MDQLADVPIRESSFMAQSRKGFYYLIKKCNYAYIEDHKYLDKNGLELPPTLLIGSDQYGAANTSFADYVWCNEIVYDRFFEDIFVLNKRADFRSGEEISAQAILFGETLEERIFVVWSFYEMCKGYRLKDT